MRIGTPAKRKTSNTKLKEARVRVARAAGWDEIEDDLVERDGGRVLVSAGSDLVYMLERGVVWEPGTAHLIATHARFAFTVRDGTVLVLQEQPGTWSQVVEKRERRRRVAS